VWIWEGVTMYLPEPAILGTLGVLEQLAAPNSTLIVSYITPAITHGTRWAGRIGAQALRSLSEPIRFVATPLAMQQLLAARAFESVSDVLPRETAAHYGARLARFAFVQPAERVMAAVKK
jgi:O-methyltransferase involved in polyketide biosynthesis